MLLSPIKARLCRERQRLTDFPGVSGCAFPTAFQAQVNGLGRDKNRVLVQRVGLKRAAPGGCRRVRGLFLGGAVSPIGGIGARLAGVPSHEAGDLIDPIGAPLQPLIKSKIPVQHVILLAEIAFPVELVPHQVTALIPLVLGETFGVEFAHRIGAFPPGRGVLIPAASKGNEKSGWLSHSNPRNFTHCRNAGAPPSSSHVGRP